MMDLTRHPVVSGLGLSGAVRWARRARLTDRAPLDHVYHCGTTRTGSAFFRGLFSDGRFYRRSGLEAIVCPPPSRSGLSELIAHPLPRWTLATPLYLSYTTFQAMPRSAAHRAFFVLRDPRALTVAWYRSMRRAAAAGRPGIAARLASLDEAAGLRQSMELLARDGVFEAQLSWALAAGLDARVAVFRFEDLLSDAAGFVARLFRFLEVSMPRGERDALAAEHAANLEGARGSEGDWMSSFTPALEVAFARLTGDLLAVLGYPARIDDLFIRPRLAA